MSKSSSSSSGPPRKKVGVEPRALPERHEESGATPFEQLNEATPEEDAQASNRGIIQPRSLPQHEEATMLEAARLLQEGRSHDEVARHLKIEPLKLRRWEQAYSAQFQQDLNEGEYHDTDAQLRELSDDSKEKFQGNWEQVTEKSTERRVKLGPIRSKLLAMPLTRWMFRNEHGAIDYGAITGIIVAIVGIAIAVRYMNQAPDLPNTEEEDLGLVIGLNEVTSIQHDSEAAAQAVIAFHRTQTWQEKLPLVSYPEMVEPLMKAWYEKHPEQVYYDRITFAMDQTLEEENRSFIQIGLLVGKNDTSRANDREFVMAVERMGDGSYKIDWETSSGYQPLSFEELTTQKPAEPVELRLTITPSDFYNFGFTPDRFIAFKATYLYTPDALYIYGRRDDPAARQLSHALQIRPSMGAIVNVRYPENAPTHDQLELVEVVAESWFRNYNQN